MDPIMCSSMFDGIHVYTAVVLLCVQQIHVCVLGHGTMKRAVDYGDKIRFEVEDKEVYDHGLKTQSSCLGIIFGFLTKLLVSEYICDAALMLYVMVLSGSKGRYSSTASIHLVLPRYILGTAGYSLSTAQISNRSVTEKVSLTE
ncbi:hypothetical protein Tco_1195523 [Tanacetum coccineum]